MEWGCRDDAGLPLGRRKVKGGEQGGAKRVPDARMLTQQALCQLLRLTPREAEVFCWLARGKTNAEIGLILGMSPRTVQKHLEHIYHKLGVETRMAAVLLVLAKGLE